RRPQPPTRTPPAPSSETPTAPSSEAPSTVQRSLVIAPEQRLVEKAGQRRDAAKHRHERCIETRTGRQGRREFASGEKLPELEELGGLVISGKAARHALQAFALEPADLSPETGRFDNRAQALHVGRNVFPDGLQLRRLRRVHSAANPDFRRRHV